MCVCMCVVNMYTLSAGYRLDAIGSRHAAKQKQMTGFFCCLLAACFMPAYSWLHRMCCWLSVPFACRRGRLVRFTQGCGPVNTNRMLHIRYKCNTHTNSIDCIVQTIFFCLNIFIIKIERKLR